MAQVVVQVAVLVTLARTFYNIVLVAGRHLQLVVAAGVPYPACRGVNDGRVASRHQRDVSLNPGLGKRVVDRPYQCDLSFLLCLDLGRVLLCQHRHRGQQAQQYSTYSFHTGVQS